VLDARADAAFGPQKSCPLRQAIEIPLDEDRVPFSMGIYPTFDGDLSHVILSEAKNRSSFPPRQYSRYNGAMPPDQAYVYILANSRRRLYIGVTTRLADRIREHKTSIDPKAFTARYNIRSLVYYECYESISRAIARETELKGWLRAKKIQLIVADNPTWRDLSLDWGKPIATFSESQRLPPETF
jgi:putative endonuclease